MIYLRAFGGGEEGGDASYGVKRGDREREKKKWENVIRQKMTEAEAKRFGWKERKGKERKAKNPLLLLHHGFFAPMCKIKRPHVYVYSTQRRNPHTCTHNPSFQL